MEDILIGMLLSVFFNCLLSQVLPCGTGELRGAGEQEEDMPLLLVHPISGTQLTGNKAFRR